MAKLVLEDGTCFVGKSLGAQQDSFGEIVFNTSMTGYQEILSDPSYAGQIVTFTYPEIGNYGCNNQDLEAKSIFVKGMVLKNYSPGSSNFRAQESLEDFLKKNNITAIYDLDTRALTRHIRDKGAMKSAIIQDPNTELEQVLKSIQDHPSMQGQDLASQVSCKEKYKGQYTAVDAFASDGKQPEKSKYKVIAYDFGIKQNIINKLIAQGCEVEVVPASTPASYVLDANPDGLFLSNGPGDPEAVSYAIATVKDLVDKYQKPIFGICLGHQILSLACGAKAFKLKFGHRGANQPIKNLENKKIEIAAHNHGFAISKDDLPDKLEITHLNINDSTIAGIKLKNRPNVFSVQYHPEASPGPQDSDYLFEAFTRLMN